MARSGDENSRAHEIAAIELRRRGDFAAAAARFADAAAAADDTRRRLDMTVRRAVCLLSIDRSAEAAALAEGVAAVARAEGHLVELADALGVMVDHHVRDGRLAESAPLLSEALDVIEQLPNEPETYQVIHNIAATYEHSGFYAAAIELFHRAFEAAEDDEERAFTRASMSSAYHFAAARCTDPVRRRHFIEEGLAVALGDEDDQFELLTRAALLSHGSMLLAHVGRDREALERARRARALAESHGLSDDALFAQAAEAIATWRLERDPSVLEQVERILATAETLNRIDELAILEEVQVDVLWSLGRFDEARSTLSEHLGNARRRVSEERAVRWEHVRLGVDHRRMAVLSTSDPLTGLLNRRHLEHALPQLLGGDRPVVIGVVDLDGFKQVNDQLGYERGDAVIREVAAILVQSCRRDDTVVRLGGDEFVVVLGTADDTVAMQVFERVRVTVERHRFVGLPDHIRLSASIGVLHLEPGDPRQLREVLAEASTAMQSSKRMGRNRITVVGAASDGR